MALLINKVFHYSHRSKPINKRPDHSEEPLQLVFTFFFVCAVLIKSHALHLSFVFNRFSSMIIRFGHRFDVIPFIFHYSVSKWEKRLEMLKQFAYKVWFNLKKICRYLFTDQQIKLVIIKLHKILFTQVLSVYKSTEVRC